MRKNWCNYLACIGLLLGLSAVRGGAVESAIDLRTIQEKIQNESDRLTRLSVKLDLLEEDLRDRKPEVAKLLAELQVLEEKMRTVRAKLSGYESGLEQFKKLSLEFQQIEANIKVLKEEAMKPWSVEPGATPSSSGVSAPNP